MNSDFPSRTNQNIIDELDPLIAMVNRQTETIDQLRTEIDSKSLENETLQEIIKKLNGSEQRVKKTD
jgi:hypothetical protein